MEDRPQACADDLLGYSLSLDSPVNRKRTRAASAKTIELYQSSIASDPSYAPAHAGLSYAYLLSVGWQFTPPLETYASAEAAARRALELDPNLSDAHIAMAVVEHEYHWNWQEAEKHFLRALELDPNSSSAHKSYGEYLMHAGRLSEAEAQMQYARDLDPVSLVMNTMVGFVYLHANDVNRAKAECQHVIAMDASYAPAHYFLACAHMREGKLNEAVREYATAKTLGDNPAMVEPSLAMAKFRLGDKVGGRRMMEQLDAQAKNSYVPSYGMAMIWLGMGEREKALRWLEKASREHESPMLFMKVDHALDSVMDDSRFAAIYYRVGFPASN